MDETRRDPLPGAAASAQEAGGVGLESLAAEYVRNRLDGRTVDVRTYLDRLPDDDARTLFLELVDGAEAADGLLPRQIREGTVLAGRYRIRRPLGAGGMGKVFAAWDETLEREVAVKVLALFDSGSVDAGSLFRRESQLLASLQHPGIVAIHETGSEGDVPYIVMDLVRGRSLADVLERLRAAAGDGAPPRAGAAWREAIDHEMPDGGRDLIGEDGYCRVAARIGAELARTVEAAHGKGVVHRDLKPGNVVLQGGGAPIVLDFGLAGRFGGAAGELTRGLFGSAAYVAPEQVRSQRTGSDPASDVYQLGLVLYEMLTLRRAFPGDEMSSVLADVCAGRFERLRKANRAVPLALEAIVLKAMELDPARRYGSATALREDLERFLRGDEAPRAMGGGRLAIALRDLRYLVRRRRLWLQVAAALLVGAAATWALAPQGARDGPLAGRPKPFTYDRVSNRLVVDPVVVETGEIIGLEVTAAQPCWVYAYSVFGPDDDPHRDVASLVPALHRGASLEPPADEDAYARRLAPGTSELLWSEVTAEDGWEGLVFFALDERDPVLEWWLRRIGGGVSRVEALDLIETARVADVFPVTRGRSVEPHLSLDARRKLLENVRRIEFELPFDHLCEPPVRLGVSGP